MGKKHIPKKIKLNKAESTISWIFFDIDETLSTAPLTIDVDAYSNLVDSNFGGYDRVEHLEKLFKRCKELGI